jgi:hypothetical protein
MQSNQPVHTNAPPARHNLIERAAIFIVVVILVGVGTLAIFHWVAGDSSEARFMGVGDAWVEYGPRMFYMDHSLDHGALPLWNSLTFCGQPAAANPQYLVFYPPNLLRSLLTPTATPMNTHRGIVAMLFAHFLLAGVSTFYLGRANGLRFAGALAASFAFAFSAPMVSRSVGHWLFVIMVAWLPLLLLCLQRAIVAQTWRRKSTYTIATGLVFGMTILGGSPHFMLLTGIMLGFSWLFFMILTPEMDKAKSLVEEDKAEGTTDDPAPEVTNHSKRAKRQRKKIAAQAAREKAAHPWIAVTWRGVVVNSAVLVVIGMLGLCIAAPMLLPAMEFSDFSARAGDSKDDIEIVDIEEADWNVFQRLAIYSGTQNYESIRAAGAAALLFALASIFLRPTRQTFFFLGLFVVLLDCSLSDPYFFGKILRSISPYKMSSPARAMLVGCLPLALLAGTGIDAAFAPLASTRKKAWRTLVAIGAGLAVLFTLVHAGTPHPFMAASLAVIIIPAISVVFAVAGGWLPATFPWSVIAAMLLFGEILVAANPYLVWLFPDALLYPKDIAAMEEPRSYWADNARGTDDEPNVLMYDLQPAMNGHDPLHMEAVRNVLCDPGGLQTYRRRITKAEVTAFNFRGNLFLKRQFWLARQYVVGSLPGLGEVFPTATTVFLDSPTLSGVPQVSADSVVGKPYSGDITEVTLFAYSAEGYEITSRADGEQPILTTKAFSLPPGHATLRIVATTTAAVKLSPVATRNADSAVELLPFTTIGPVPGKAHIIHLPLPDFAELSLGVVAEFLGGEGVLRIHDMKVVIDNEDEDTLIRINDRGANHVSLTIGELPAPRILTFIDAHYAGWQAYIDGEETPILKANDVFKAIAIPAGTHTVEFAFRPRRVYLGVSLALTALAMSAAALGLIFTRRER